MYMNPCLVTAHCQQLIFVSYVSPNLPTKQLFKTFRVKPRVKHCHTLST